MGLGPKAPRPGPQSKGLLVSVCPVGSCGVSSTVGTSQTFLNDEYRVLPPAAVIS